MKLNFLTTAVFGISILSLSACAPNYQAIDTSATTPTLPTTTHNTHASWSYQGHTAPEYWGDIDGNQTCKIGQEQSPINITKATATASATPVINYNTSADVLIHDNGHTIVYTPTTPTNTIKIGTENYQLKQFHYHMPSEHQIGGQHYPGELHFVHANPAGELAVIGIMLQKGDASDVMRVLLNGTELTVGNKVDFTANGVNLAKLMPKAPTFYHYDGSLTTPPCSEKVQWYVLKQPLSLASDQLAVMADLYSNNNRPVQPQGKRLVEQLGQ